MRRIFYRENDEITIDYGAIVQTAKELGFERLDIETILSLQKETQNQRRKK